MKINDCIIFVWMKNGLKPLEISLTLDLHSSILVWLRFIEFDVTIFGFPLNLDEETKHNKFETQSIKASIFGGAFSALDCK